MALQLKILLTTFIVLIGCVEPKPDRPVKADCDAGFKPCESDSTQCCEVICPPGYYLGGIDSTDCLEIICPPGYQLGGIDSTECIEIVCPPNFHNCGENLTACCLDTVLYGNFHMERTWVYNSSQNTSGPFGDSRGKRGTEIWEVTSISPDSLLIQIDARWTGIIWTAYNGSLGPPSYQEDTLSTHTQAELDLTTGKFNRSPGSAGFSGLALISDNSSRVFLLQPYEGEDFQRYNEWWTEYTYSRFSLDLNINIGIESTGYVHQNGFDMTHSGWSVELVE